MKFINNELIDDKKIKQLRESFNNTRMFKHVFIENFLTEKDAKEILRALKEEKFEHKESDLFSLSQTEDFSAVKDNILKKFYEFFCSFEFGEYIEKISGIKLAGKIDMSGSLYESCDYLLCHDDKLENRKIAFVYYLSDLDEKDGGAFVLLESSNGRPVKEMKKYLPLWNSFLMFEVSEKSFHEVEEVLTDKKRYAIGGWFY